MGPDDYVLKHRSTPGRRVRDLSMGGLFIETLKPIAVGTTTNLHFLVLAQEGQIRADALVRHVETGRGLGLQFRAVLDEVRLHLAELMKRHRHSSYFRGCEEEKAISKYLCDDAEDVM